MQSSLKGRGVRCPGQGLKQKRRSVHWLLSFFPAQNQVSLLFNYCHISNHIQNKSQNDNVQIKAPRKMKALVCYNSVTCHSQSAPWFTKHFLITLPHWIQSSWQPWLPSCLFALPSCLDTWKTQAGTQPGNKRWLMTGGCGSKFIGGPVSWWVHGQSVFWEPSLIFTISSYIYPAFSYVLFTNIIIQCHQHLNNNWEVR